ncbi:LysR family transcriptional regulator [Xanthomonas translucens pv. translucens]|uniref:LysR family transcriptional regulator n=1 Tax=Xanthomonas campestris pv. translucens TaxID=343 RepID=UPI003F7007D6
MRNAIGAVLHNVTRAAERLHLSQSSVSVHLAKLRAALDDPLLLPGPRGMRPTARAEALRAPLRQALEALQRAVAAKAPFVPAQAGNRWRVAATDYDESTILLPALAALRRVRGWRCWKWRRCRSRARPSGARSTWPCITATAHRQTCATHAVRRTLLLHERVHRDRAHRWLREHIAASV